MGEEIIEIRKDEVIIRTRDGRLVRRPILSEYEYNEEIIKKMKPENNHPLNLREIIKIKQYERN